MNYLPDVSLLLPFIGSCWLLQTSPGPDMLLIVGKGVNYGAKEALLSALGIYIAVAIQAPVVVLGGAAALAQSELAYSILKGLGASYLIYLAVMSIKAFFQFDPSIRTNTHPKNRTSVRDGFVTNVTNPKVIIFMLAFVPQFTSPDKGTIGIQLLVLILIMKTNGLVVNSLIGIAASNVRNLLTQGTKYAKWQHLLSGILFLSMAVWFISDITGS